MASSARTKITKRAKEIWARGHGYTDGSYEREVGGDGRSGGAGAEKDAREVGNGGGSVGAPSAGPWHARGTHRRSAQARMWGP